MSGAGVAVDSTGNAYVVGGEGGGQAVYSVNAVQPVSHSNDAYILKLNPAGTALAFSTPFGGAGISNQSSVATAVAIDPAGNAYFTGSTNASDFPVTSGAPQSTKPGGQSSTAFVSKIGVQTNDCPTIEIGPQPLPVALFGQSYAQQLTATGGTGPYIFSLAPNFPNNFLPAGLTLSSDGLISGVPTTVNLGTYLVTIQAADQNGCIGIRTLQLVLDTFHYTGSPDLLIKVVDRPVIRIGNEYTFFVLYKNRTNADLTNVPLAIAVPDFVSISPKFEQPFQTFHYGGNTFIVLTLLRIPATSNTAELMSLPVTIKVDDPLQAHRLFDVVAYTFPPPSGANQVASNKAAGWVAPNGDDPPPPPPPPVPPAGPLGHTDPRTPNDPNDKSGAIGAGVENFYTGDIDLPYVVTFENIDTASLPAQDVVVTDQLDPAVFDFSTFRFNLVAFGDKQVSPQIGANQFTSDVDLRPAKQAIVRVSGNFNSSTGLISWQFHTLDPATGLPPEDPQAGFLPPNVTSPEGQGTLFYTVKAKAGLPTGTQVKNKARIVFDVNAPIDTPEWLNTIDNDKPVSRVRALPSFEPLTFTLNWSGTDAGSGINSYTIYLSQDGGPYLPYLTNTTQTSIIVSAVQTNHTLRFYSIATDAAGNVEPAKTSAEATTTLVAPVSVSGRVTDPDGRGLRNVVVSITDPSGSSQNATTSAFGFYSFANVAPGQQYVVRVASRLFRFVPKTLQVTDTLSNVDFVGLE